MKGLQQITGQFAGLTPSAERPIFKVFGEPTRPVVAVPHCGMTVGSGPKAERATRERRRPVEPDPDNAGEGMM